MSKITPNNLFEIKTTNRLINYHKSLEFMQKKVDKIIENKDKELVWFLNYNHIYTCGTSFKKNEILKKIEVPIIKTNRGGKITYHGPGQRIIYLMINLNKRKKDIRKFIDIIEKSVILLLRELDITSQSYPNRVGIWVTKNKNEKLEKEKKIGSIGLRIKRWVSYHGLSVNLNPDLSYFDFIKACGLNDYSATSLKELNINIDNIEFDNMFIKHFKNQLDNFY